MAQASAQIHEFPTKRRQKFANADEVAELAVTLSNAALTCRDLGHTWRSQTIETNSLGYLRTLRCTRCRTRRRQQLNRRGHAMTNNYEYAENYLFDRPLGRLAGDAKSALRLVSVQRELERQ